MEGRLRIACRLAAPLVVLTGLAGTLPAQAPADGDVLRWTAVPFILPPGARIAVVSGDPTMPGPTIVELIMPDGYRMPPLHHHLPRHQRRAQAAQLPVRVLKPPHRAAAESTSAA